MCNDKFELSDGCCSVLDIQDYNKCIIKNEILSINSTIYI